MAVMGKPRPHRRITGRLVDRDPQFRQACGNARILLAPYEIEAISARYRLAMNPTRAERALRADRAHQGRSGGPSALGLAGLPTILASRAFDALAGAPGISSGPPGGTRERLLSSRCSNGRAEVALRRATAPAQRKAHFVSALCVAWPDGHVEEFEACAGRRRDRLAPRGRQGLRLRSDLLPDGQARTFGENAKR